MKVFWFLLIVGLASAANLSCDRAYQLTENWWAFEATTGTFSDGTPNPFGPYVWVKQMSPKMPNDVVYTVGPAGFFGSTSNGKSAVVAKNKFGGLGTPSAAIGVLNVTVDRMRCFFVNDQTVVIAWVRKAVVFIPAVNTTGQTFILPYMSQMVFDPDERIVETDEYIDTLCTACLVGASVTLTIGSTTINLCSYCGLAP